jgi:MFS family permease
MPEAIKTRLRKALPEKGPLRFMAASTIINTFGNGLFFTIEVIFLTRSVGLTPHEVGIGFTIAAAIALPISIPAGHLADRLQIRNWVAGSQIFQGLAAASFIFIHSFAVFLVLTILVEAIGTGTQTLRMTLITRLSGGGEDRVRFRAYLRAVTNLGIGAGASFAGIALAIDTRTAYATLVVLNGLTFIIAALMFLRLPLMPLPPKQDPTAEKKEPRFVALRDKRYVAATLLNGFYSIHFIIQGVGIPLWIVNYTSAPRWTVSLVMLVNTVACVLFSVRASRGTGDIQRAARIYFRAGLFVAAGSVVYAFAQGVRPWIATALLVGGMLLHVTGELLGSGAGWGLGFGLARDEFQGQYQGVWQLGWGLGAVVGPALITFLVVDWQKTGWLILGAIFIATTYLFIPLVRSYEKKL